MFQKHLKSLHGTFYYCLFVKTNVERVSAMSIDDLYESTNSINNELSKLFVSSKDKSENIEKGTNNYDAGIS